MNTALELSIISIVARFGIDSPVRLQSFRIRGTVLCSTPASRAAARRKWTSCAKCRKAPRTHRIYCGPCDYAISAAKAHILGDDLAAQ